MSDFDDLFVKKKRKIKKEIQKDLTLKESNEIISPIISSPKRSQKDDISLPVTDSPLSLYSLTPPPQNLTNEFQLQSHKMR